MKRFSLFLSITFFISASIFAQSSMTAKSVINEASKKSSISETVNYLSKTIPTLSKSAEKRSSYAFLGSIQEQLGFYNDALKSYAAAAAIEAGDAEGMPKKSSEQLVIDAIRCALSVGDYVSADKYLKSAVKNSKNENIIAYVKLYEQWSFLTKANDISETKSAIDALKKYSTLDSMKIVEPSILLTLFHLTGEETYSSKLKTKYPNSLEAGVVKGNVTQIPNAFWYFVPRSSFKLPSYLAKVDTSFESQKNEPEIENKTENKTESKKAESSDANGTKLQLGLFREEDNAKRLVEKLKEKGFTGLISSEVRPSGTKYYLVYVRDNSSKTMSQKLRDEGFDCYPLFE